MGLALGASLLFPLALASASADVPLPEEAAVPFSDIQFQTRTEVRQRVIVRITPLSRVSRPQVQADEEPIVVHSRRPIEDCIPLSNIAGVRLGSGRNLLLYLRDKRVIGTKFDRTCQVSSFYSGFYVERSEDGLLCAGREALHARSGADCVLSSFHEVETDGD
ncbi:hypothetical protein [Croceicoccus naphthovorans]|uniref:hypothetical protein n=1 Tax=Croceicoccus naphthovorans TaxID=1348774 RepID=UPI00069F6A1A|nr:hypothetical protein [Croceicoccus naphthovorans]MBB3990780.1 hypothetical protein [Croceicoccus naphthovorans]